jgi:hypothetical protein
MRNFKGDITRYYRTRSTGKEVGVATVLRRDVFETLTSSGCLEIEEHIIIAAAREVIVFQQKTIKLSKENRNPRFEETKILAKIIF